MTTRPLDVILVFAVFSFIIININITNVKLRTTPVPVVGTLLPIDIAIDVKSSTTPVPVLGTLLPINITNV